MNRPSISSRSKSSFSPLLGKTAVKEPRSMRSPSLYFRWCYINSLAMDAGTNSGWQTSSRGTSTIFDGCRFHRQSLIPWPLYSTALNCLSYKPRVNFLLNIRVINIEYFKSSFNPFSCHLARRNPDSTQRCSKTIAIRVILFAFVYI